MILLVIRQSKSIILHKVEKTFMLETDVSEIMSMSVKRGRYCGIIAVYEPFDIGALMEKTSVSSGMARLQSGTTEERFCTI